jgi:hypothetical protein
MGVGSRRTPDAGNGFSPIGKQKKMGTRRKREGGEYTTGRNRGEGDGRKKMRGEQREQREGERERERREK